MVWVTTAALIALAVTVPGFVRAASQAATDLPYDPAQVTAAASWFLLGAVVLALVSLTSGIMLDIYRTSSGGQRSRAVVIA